MFDAFRRRAPRFGVAAVFATVLAVVFVTAWATDASAEKRCPDPPDCPICGPGTEEIDDVCVPVCPDGTTPVEGKCETRVKCDDAVCLGRGQEVKLKPEEFVCPDGTTVNQADGKCLTKEEPPGSRECPAGPTVTKDGRKWTLAYALVPGSEDLCEGTTSYRCPADFPNFKNGECLKSDGDAKVCEPGLGDACVKHQGPEPCDKDGYELTHNEADDTWSCVKSDKPKCPKGKNPKYDTTQKTWYCGGLPKAPTCEKAGYDVTYDDASDTWKCAKTDEPECANGEVAIRNSSGTWVCGDPVAPENCTRKGYKLTKVSTDNGEAWKCVLQGKRDCGKLKPKKNKKGEWVCGDSKPPVCDAKAVKKGYVPEYHKPSQTWACVMRDSPTCPGGVEPTLDSSGAWVCGEPNALEACSGEGFTPTKVGGEWKCKKVDAPHCPNGEAELNDDNKWVCPETSDEFTCNGVTKTAAQWLEVTWEAGTWRYEASTGKCVRDEIPSCPDNAAFGAIYEQGGKAHGHKCVLAVEPLITGTCTPEGCGLGNLTCPRIVTLTKGKIPHDTPGALQLMRPKPPASPVTWERLDNGHRVEKGVDYSNHKCASFAPAKCPGGKNPDEDTGLCTESYTARCADGFGEPVLDGKGGYTCKRSLPATCAIGTASPSGTEKSTACLDIKVATCKTGDTPDGTKAQANACAPKPASCAIGNAKPRGEIKKVACFDKVDARCENGGDPFGESGCTPTAPACKIGEKPASGTYGETTCRDTEVATCASGATPDGSKALESACAPPAATCAIGSKRPSGAEKSTACADTDVAICEKGWSGPEKKKADNKTLKQACSPKLASCAADGVTPTGATLASACVHWVPGKCQSGWGNPSGSTKSQACSKAGDQVCPDGTTPSGDRCFETSKTCEQLAAENQTAEGCTVKVEQPIASNCTSGTTMVDGKCRASKPKLCPPGLTQVSASGSDTPECFEITEVPCKEKIVSCSASVTISPTITSTGSTTNGRAPRSVRSESPGDSVQ